MLHISEMEFIEGRWDQLKARDRCRSKARCMTLFIAKKYVHPGRGIPGLRSRAQESLLLPGERILDSRSCAQERSASFVQLGRILMCKRV